MGLKTIFVLLALVCLVPVALAEGDFSVRYNPVKDKIFLNETAEFKLLIRNNLARDTDFLIYPGVVEWDVTTSPQHDRQKTVDRESEEAVTVLIKPNQFFWPNIYGIPIRIKNLATNEVITKEVLLEIKGDGGQISGEYLPAVQVTFKIDEEVDPREGLDVTVVLRNQNSLNMSRVRVILKSRLIDKEYETSLSGLETKTLKFRIPFDPYLKPQSDLLNVKVLVPHKERTYEFYARSDTYDIIQYGQISEEIEEEKLFLKTLNQIKLTNIGNVEREYKYRVRKRFYSGLFISTSPPPNIELIDGKTYYTWQGRLSPKEAHSIQIVLSYRWLAFVIGLIIVVWLGYFMLRSPIVVTKHAVVANRAEGGVSQLNIQIYIKNRSARRFHSIEIRDKVPNLLIVKNEFNIGTLAPTNILKHSKRGTIIKWNIDDFDPFEERIISYKTSAKLPILGEFSLPKAVIKYKRSLASDYRYVHSNVFRMEYGK